jgi:methylthioribose-1-phosphate isomerase
MWVRGAPLIGVTAAYGMALQMHDWILPDAALSDTGRSTLHDTRPTAINLRWALDEMRTAVLRPLPARERARRLLMHARHAIAEEDVEINRRIGRKRPGPDPPIAATKAAGEPVNILTHCNAGWLATVDWGTATSPIYHLR